MRLANQCSLTQCQVPQLIIIRKSIKLSQPRWPKLVQALDPVVIVISQHDQEVRVMFQLLQLLDLVLKLAVLIPPTPSAKSIPVAKTKAVVGQYVMITSQRKALLDQKEEQ